MKTTTITLSFLLFSSTLFAYQDYDIDGVEDSVDLCPNTPFDILVNKDGCPNDGKTTKSGNYLGRLTFKIGSDMSIDETYEDANSLNLYANYRYRKWDVSIANSRSTTDKSYSEDNSNSDEDIYLSTGYTFSLPKKIIKFSVGTKIVGDTENSTTNTPQGKGRFTQYVPEEVSTSRDNDYFASLNLSYLLNSKQNIFLYSAHTLSGDSNGIDYEDYSSFSIGTGYLLTPSWYSAVSYNYTGSIYPDADAEQGLSWFNSYKFDKNIFATVAYQYGLEDFSYDHTFSLGLGLSFE